MKKILKGFKNRNTDENMWELKDVRKLMRKLTGL